MAIFSDGSRIAMTSSDKDKAEAVIKRLCIGASISGIRFGTILQILISQQDPQKQSTFGQIYLNLESKWLIYKSIREIKPQSENNIPDLTNEEEIQSIIGIRERKITDIKLMRDCPHLLITLDDGRVIFLNGKDDNYETWTIGTAFRKPDETYLVVACPGGNVAVWDPEEYKSS